MQSDLGDGLGQLLVGYSVVLYDLVGLVYADERQRNVREYVRYLYFHDFGTYEQEV